MRTDVLVVGAGFSGAVVARQLAERGLQVFVIDRRDHIGGNAHDRTDAHGVLVHPYGPHIFHTNSARIFEYLSQFTGWRPYEHRVLASVDGRLVPLPINIDTVNRLYGLSLDEDTIQAFFDDVREPRDPIRTSEDVVVNAVGRDLYEKFFRGYTRKQWGLDPSELAASVAARIPTRTLASDWWVYSFTQLANAEGQADATASATQPAAGGLDEPAADAEVDADADAFDPRFAGPRFGVVLHDVLERTDFAQWSAWTPGTPAPTVEDAALIAERLRAGGYPGDAIDDGIAVLTPLIGHTLTVPLPEGVRLADVPAPQRRPEIEFQFALAPTRVDALLALLHRHGLLTARQGFGARRRLEGLMTGLIDLTYVHDGRWYLLDYKTNRLPGYGRAQLDEAMARSEYDLQALIYTLALHRWLRFRLGDGYDYPRDFGGVRYLFCRGLDATRNDGQGVQAWRFDPQLVHALDALFAGQTAPVGDTAVEPLSRLRGEEACLRATGSRADERPSGDARAGARSGGRGDGTTPGVSR